MLNQKAPTTTATVTKVPNGNLIEGHQDCELMLAAAIKIGTAINYRTLELTRMVRVPEGYKPSFWSTHFTLFTKNDGIGFTQRIVEVKSVAMFILNPLPNL